MATVVATSAVGKPGGSSVGLTLPSGIVAGDVLVFSASNDAHGFYKMFLSLNTGDENLVKMGDYGSSGFLTNLALWVTTVRTTIPTTVAMFPSQGSSNSLNLHVMVLRGATQVGMSTSIPTSNTQVFAPSGAARTGTMLAFSSAHTQNPTVVQTAGWSAYGSTTGSATNLDSFFLLNSRPSDVVLQPFAECVSVSLHIPDGGLVAGRGRRGSSVALLGEQGRSLR